MKYFFQKPSVSLVMRLIRVVRTCSMSLRTFSLQRLLMRVCVASRGAPWRMLVSSFVLSGASLGGLAGCTTPKAMPPVPVLAKSAAHWKLQWSKWSLTKSHDQYLPFTPALDHGRLYTADAGGKIAALNAVNGRVLWVNKTHTPITTGVAVGPSLVYVATSAGNVLAFSKQSGRRQWFQSLPGAIVATPLVASGRVFITTESGNLYAYNAQTGHVIWNFSTAAPGLVLRLGGRGAVYRNKVIFGFANGQLASLSQASGFPDWRIQFAHPEGSTVVSRMVDVDAPLLVKNNIVYVVTYRGKIAAVHATNGHIIWQHPMSSFTGMSLSDTALYVSDVAGRVWAFDRRTGRVLWQQQQLLGRGPGAPTWFNGSVVVGDAGGYLYAFSAASGKLQALTHAARGPIFAPPQVFNNTVIVNAQSGPVESYRLLA